MQTFFMNHALKLAKKAALQDEVPVGAVITADESILGEGFNLRESNNLPTAHAEIIAIEAAARRLGQWRLLNTVLYVTLEPCLMCWGAIVNARIPHVVFGARDPKAGVCGSLLSLHQETRLNHHPKITAGVMEQECGELLSRFFQDLRMGQKNAERMRHMTKR